MTLYEIISIMNLVILAMSLVVFGRLLWAGRLSEKYLRLGPTRELHQPVWVYFFVVAVVLLYSTVKLTVTGEQPPAIVLGTELIPYALVGLMIGRARSIDAGFRKIGLVPRWPGRDTCWGLIGGVIGLGLAGAVGMAVNFVSTKLGQPIDPVGHEALQTLRDEFSVELLVALTISAVILAPLVEELVFRGALQTSLLRLFGERRWPALLIASAVFSIIHYSVVPWQGLIPLFVLGLVFGYVYERTGSLLTPILAHAGFNAANIAIALSMPEQLQ